MSHDDEIGRRIGDALNAITNALGSSADVRGKVLATLAHHVAEEMAFAFLEHNTDIRTMQRSFDAAFEDGLRCAARNHTELCKHPENCFALETLRVYIRHAPQLKEKREAIA